jgi:RNA polymerase sigma-70 factor (ECF subfamily)
MSTPEEGRNSAASTLPPAEPTVEMVRRIRNGDTNARGELVRRYTPMIRRWASGRLPSNARNLTDTDDLVQVAMIRALNHIDNLRLEHPGALFVYLKQVVLNAIKDEIRRNRARNEHVEIQADSLQVEAQSPDDPEKLYVDLDAYEKVLATLPKRQQRLLVMRLEFGLAYDEIAQECSTTADAARMMVSRAVLQLARAKDQLYGK